MSILPHRSRTADRTALGVIAALVVLAGAHPSAGEIAFQKRDDLAIGSSPSAFAYVAGAPGALVVANADGLAAYRFDDDGFVPGPRTPIGRGAQVLVVGPLRANGAPAVAFATREAARIAVAPIDERGSIATPEQIELPGLPRAAHIAPLDTGAPASLFVAHDGGLSILVRAPAGWRRIDVTMPPFTRDFAVGDVNGDGHTDLVMAEEASGQLSVLLGAGDGTFTAGSRIATVRGPRRVVIADVNGDRHLDVLVIGNDTLALHLGDARGAFAAAQPLQHGDHLADVAVADVDGDGRGDLAVLDRSRSMVTLLLARAGGRFESGDSYLVGYGAEAALIVDVDGDRRPDVLTLNRLGDSTTLLRGLRGGVFDGIVCLRSDIGDLTALTSEDFNGDDQPDLAVASENGGAVDVFLGRGDGRFTAMPPLNVGRQPRALATGDFNQDGNIDLAVVNFGADSVAILQGDGRGGFAAPRAITVGTGPSAISTGSFGADTATDLAIVNSLSNSVSVLYGDGHGQFPDVATFPVAARPSFLIVGDTNRDGHQDLVVGSQFSESVAILLGDGHRLGAPSTNTLKGTARPSEAEDFDRDGQMDLVNPDETAGLVEVLPGTAPGSFGTPVRVSVGRDPHAVAIGDYDRDGRIDIAVAHRGTQMIAILLNRSAPKRVAPPHGDRADDRGSARHS